MTRWPSAPDIGPAAGRDGDVPALQRHGLFCGGDLYDDRHGRRRDGNRRHGHGLRHDHLRTYRWRVTYPGNSRNSAIVDLRQRGHDAPLTEQATRYQTLVAGHTAGASNGAPARLGRCHRSPYESSTRCRTRLRVSSSGGSPRHERRWRRVTGEASRMPARRTWRSSPGRPTGGRSGLDFGSSWRSVVPEDQRVGCPGLGFHPASNVRRSTILHRGGGRGRSPGPRQRSLLRRHRRDRPSGRASRPSPTSPATMRCRAG